MQKIRVGVLRGGPSNEYDVSLKTGSTVLKNLPEEKYETRDIYISKQGEWHFRGIPIRPENILNQIDVVFNAMHGEYGEDGTVQQILDTFSIPYTGSNAFSSAICMNKLLTKQGLEGYDINMPEYLILDSPEDVEKDIFNIFRSFIQPSIIKPVIGGSSIGISLARDFYSLKDGVLRALGYSPQILIEEYIHGREVTCGVIDNFRGEELYALMPIEIAPPFKNGFFDYEAKYKDYNIGICPAPFERIIKDEVQRLAKEAHRALGLRHYSRSDFIISPRGIYFLEINTLPRLKEMELGLSAIGSSATELLEHTISSAIEDR